jgi:hypothetical protein
MMKVASYLVNFKVVVGGRAVQEFNKEGNVFVEGRQGSNFELELANLTGRKLLVHPTVDGLSAMTGKEASKNDSSNGYVLPPYSTMRVPGWRLDDDAVAKFYFAGAGQSYAEKQGGGADKGVIAAAIWEEKVVFKSSGVLRSTSDNMGWGPRGQQDNNPQYKGLGSTICGSSINCCTTPDAGSVHGEPTNGFVSTQNLGTGFGERAEHQVHEVSFTPETVEPTAVAVIYYDDRRGLMARGIKLSSGKKRRDGLPNPFPKDKGCTPPTGWRS